MARALLATVCVLACLVAASVAIHPDKNRKLLQAADPCSPTRATAGAYQDDDVIAPGTCTCPTGYKAWCCMSDNLASPTTCKAAATPGCCAGLTYADPEDRETEMLDDVWCVPTSCNATGSAIPAAAGR